MLPGAATDPDSPQIFGPNENEGLDIEASRTLFEQLTNEINEGKPDKLSLEQVAAGFLRVANETMCRPIRTYVWLGPTSSRHTELTPKTV